MERITRPRGTEDLLPGRSDAIFYLEEVARRVAARFGFSQVRTPVFESTVLFEHGVGEQTDVVQKEMYTLQDRSGRSLTLRPEGTAPLVRAYIESGMASQGMLLKGFYLQPNFRYERPQSGRLRQHTQFGAECFGAAGPLADAELIIMAVHFLREVGIAQVTVRLNSLGCGVCRPAYRQAVLQYYRGHEQEVCPTCQVRLEKNPLRLLDCKEQGDQALLEGAPKAFDHLCDDCRSHQSRLLELLEEEGIPFRLDGRIVRGLDYYTRTVFELYGEAGYALGGGGRYDALVQHLGGPSLPAVGFGIGLERVRETLAEANRLPAGSPRPFVYVAFLSADLEPLAQHTALSLRQRGVDTDLDFGGRGLKGQLKQAARREVPWAVILGPDEIAGGQVVLRNMAQGTQETIPLAEALAVLAERATGEDGAAV